MSSHTRLKVLYGILMVASVLASYLPVLDGSFVYDDLPYIVDNPAVTSPTLENVFADTFPPGRMDTALYRPLLTLSFALDRILPDFGRGYAFVAHRANLKLHVATCLLLFFLLVCRVDVHAAFFASALYACHPVLSESVAWVTGRSEILIGLWCLAGIAWIQFKASSRCRSMGLFFITLCALLTKESAVMLPFIWAVSTCMLREDDDRYAPTWRLLMPSFALVAASVVIRYLVFAGVSPGMRAFADVDSMTRYRIVFMTFYRNVQLVLFPVNQSVHWPPYPMAISKLQVLAGLVLLVLGLGTACVGVVRRRLWGFGVAWFMLMLIPYSNAVIAIGSVMAERFLYAPCLGLAIAAAWGLSRVRLHTAPGMRVAAISACVACLMVLGIATHRRAMIWRDEVSLWRAAMRAYPTDMVSQVATAFYLVKRQDDASFADLATWWPQARESLAHYEPGSLPPLIAKRLEWIETELLQYEVARANATRRQD